MSSPSTQAVLPTCMQNELSDAENLLNPSTTSNNETAMDLEGGDSLSTDDEFDVQLGTATFMPLRRAPVHRIRIPRRRQTTPSRSHHHNIAERRLSRSAPTSPTRIRITTPHPVSERAAKRAATPPPAIPEKSLRRAGPLQSFGTERDTRRDGIVLPRLRLRTLSPTALKCTVVAIPTVLPQKTNVVLKAPPKRKAEILAPIPQRYTMEKLVKSLAANSAYSSSMYSSDDDDEDVWVGIQSMYAEHQAGRLVFPPSPEPLPRTEEQEVREERWAMEIFERQRKIFEVVEGRLGEREFRSPFAEEEVMARDLEDVLAMVQEPPVREQVTLESVLRAVYDESILGSSSSASDISPGNARLVGAEAAPTAPTSLPVGRVQQYDFIAADAWLFDGEEEEEEEQDEIVNPYRDEFTFSGKGWTVLEAERAWSRSALYSAPPRPSSTLPHNRSTEAILYTPVENPFSADEDFNFIDNPMEDEPFLAGLDVDALVADAQDTRLELQDTDKLKGGPDILTLAPQIVHDPSQWCHCLECGIFRERAGERAFWTTHFNKLDAETEEFEAEERRAKANLLNFKASEASMPKKTCRLGKWVRRHLACPSSGE
ncbi:hypothetical protein V8E51_013501 [Hyaloscypha variabilis]